MKRIWNLVLILSIVIPSGLTAGTLAQAQGAEFERPPLAQGAELELPPPAQIDPAPVLEPPQDGGMPGWPVPEVPIPYHEPGRPVRGTSYSTRAVRQNELGLDEVVQLTGLDALLADSVMADPFQGNYRLVEENQVFAGLLNISTGTLGLQTVDIEDETLDPLEDTDVSVATVIQTDVAAGDLNGDGIDEQITAWFEDASGDLHLSIGEMPVSSELPGVIPPGVTAQPGAVSYPDGSMDLVVRGYDGALWHNHYDGSSWGDWNNDAGGLLLSGPAITSRSAGQFDVFAYGFDPVDPNRAVVYTRHYESGGWTGSWAEVDASDPGLPISQSLPLPTLPAPAAAARGSSNVDVFWLNEDNTLHWCEFNGSTCVSEEDLGGMLASGPGAVALSSNEMKVFARGVNDSLWYRPYNSGWGSWELLEMPADIAATSAPAVVTPAASQLAVFVQGRDLSLPESRDSLYYNSLVGGVWTGWQLIWVYSASNPSPASGSGIAAAPQGGGIRVFAQMQNGSLGEAQYSTSLSSWEEDSLPASTEFVVEALAIPDLRSPLKVEAGHYWGAGRALYVVAYVTAAREINVNLFDIGGEGDGFTPNLLDSLLLDVEYSTAEGQDDMDMAAGDVDGDGLDEIVVASIEGIRAGDLWLNVVKVTDCDSEGCTLVDQNQPGEASPPWSQFGDNVMYTSTIHIATGDLDGDTTDEVAVLSTGNWIGGDSWRPLLQVVDDGVENAELYPDICDFDDGDAMQPGPCTSGDLAVGNFIEEVGPIKDEIAFYGPVIWDCLGTSSNQCHRWYRALIYQLDGTNLTEVAWYDDPVQEYLTGKGLDPTPVDQAAVVLSDLDADFLDEMVLARCYYGTCTSYLFEPITLNDPPPSNPLVPGDTSELNSVGNPYDRVYLTAGDSLGESVRVGPPSYRHQQDTAQVIAIVNAPPKHEDVIDSVVHNLNADDEGTYSQFDQVIESSTEVSVTTQKDWGVDSNFEATIGDPDATHVKTSIENSYGENFENTGGSTKSLTYNQSISAKTDDVLFYTRLDYDVWEYPVYNSMTFSPQGHLSVVWPASEIQSVVGQANACNSWYRPNHQLMNVWSYPASEAQLLDRANEDKDLIGLPIYTIGVSDVDFSVEFSTVDLVSQSHEYEMGFASSFESQIGGEEIGVNLGVVEFSTRLPSIFFSTRGEYTSSELSQWTTQTTDTTRLSGYFVGHSGYSDYLYSVKPYLYWSEDDYLVLDYVTDPSNQAFWSPLGAYYNRPDPAFIYPWADGQCDHLWPDAHFLTSDIGIVPPVAEVGDTVTITATLRNFSNVGNDSPPFNQSFKVSFYHGDPDAGGELIDEQIVAVGALGPREVLALSFEWIASGAGEQHMYVVIDSEDSLTEVHDENDPDINNNKGYGVLTMDEIEFVDMGLATEKAYHAINYRMGDPSPLSTLYPPLGTLTQNLRIEIRYAEGFESLNIIGSPFKIIPYQTDWEDPESSFSFRSEVGDPPGVIMIDYAGADLSGFDESDLTLWHFNGSVWEDATCASYQTYRFPVEDVLFVPLCDLTYSSSVAGTFALGGDSAPVPIALVADFSADPLSGAAPLEVQFQDESLGNPTSWEWDFGDESELCYDQNPLYEFTGPGTYTVTLTVSNVFDDTDVEEKLAYITVLEEQKLYLPLIMR